MYIFGCFNNFTVSDLFFFWVGGGGGGFFLEVHDTVLKYHYDTRTEIQAILKMKYLATQVGS